MSRPTVDQAIKQNIGDSEFVNLVVMMTWARYKSCFFYFQMHCFSPEYADNNFSWFTHLDGVDFKDMHGKLEELSSRIPGIGQKPQFHVSLGTKK